jgi:hypothetical protein
MTAARELASFATNSFATRLRGALTQHKHELKSRAILADDGAREVRFERVPTG